MIARLVIGRRRLASPELSDGDGASKTNASDVSCRVTERDQAGASRNLRNHLEQRDRVGGSSRAHELLVGSGASRHMAEGEELQLNAKNQE